MTSDVYVTASGAALAYLMYENVKASTQVGFLLGAVINQVTDTISDSQMRGEKTETIIHISSVLPMHNARSFSNGAGKVDKSELAKIHENLKAQQQDQDHKHDIVGWYCFNHNSSSHMSMWEKVTHVELSQFAGHLAHGSRPELFVLCLLSNSNSTMISNATHSYKHSFMCYSDDTNSFKTLPLQIVNLGQALHMQYQLTASPQSTSLLQEKLLSRVNQNGSYMDKMLEAQKILQKSLNQDVLRLAQMEKHHLHLLQEVQLMRHELKTKKERLTFEDERCGAEGEGGVSAGGEYVMHSDFYKSSGSTDMETDIDKVERSTSPVLQTSRSRARPCT